MNPDFRARLSEGVRLAEEFHARAFSHEGDCLTFRPECLPNREEAAAVLGVSERTVRRMVERGELKPCFSGNTFLGDRFLPEDLTNVLFRKATQRLKPTGKASPQAWAEIVKFCEARFGGRTGLATKLRGLVVGPSADADTAWNIYETVAKWAKGEQAPNRDYRMALVSCLWYDPPCRERAEKGAERPCTKSCPFIGDYR